MPNTIRELKAQYPEAIVTKVANNTFWVLERHTGTTHIILHRTAVITRGDTGWETLRTGGYKTVTTKDRINRFAINGQVYQKDFQWYIRTKRGTFLFDFDSIQVTPGGYVYNMAAIYPLPSLEDAKAAIKAQRAKKGVTK